MKILQSIYCNKLIVSSLYFTYKASYLENRIGCFGSKRTSLVSTLSEGHSIPIIDSRRFRLRSRRWRNSCQLLVTAVRIAVIGAPAYISCCHLLTLYFLLNKRLNQKKSSSHFVFCRMLFWNCVTSCILSLIFVWRCSYFLLQRERYGTKKKMSSMTFTRRRQARNVWKLPFESFCGEECVWEAKEGIARLNIRNVFFNMFFFQKEITTTMTDRTELWKRDDDDDEREKILL